MPVRPELSRVRNVTYSCLLGATVTPALENDSGPLFSVFTSLPESLLHIYLSVCLSLRENAAREGGPSCPLLHGGARPGLGRGSGETAPLWRGWLEEWEAAG